MLTIGKNLPFTMPCSFSNAKCRQEINESAGPMHFEFGGGDRHHSHGQILRVCLDVCHVHVSPEENGVLLHFLVLFVLRLDLAQVVAHLTDNSEFDFAVIRTVRLRQVLAKLLKSMFDQSVSDTLMVFIGFRCWIAQKVGWNYFGFLNCSIFQLQKLRAIVAVFVCLATTDKVCEESEPRFFLQIGEVLIVLNQYLILFLSPLVLICWLKIILLSSLLVVILKTKDGLLVAEDYILVVGATELELALSVRLFVDQAGSAHTQWVVIEDLVLDLFGLEAEEGLEKEHGVVLLQSDEFTNDDHDHGAELLKWDL